MSKKRFNELVESGVVVRNINLNNNCDICGKLGRNLVDSPINGGSWGILCPNCYETKGSPLVPKGPAIIVNFSEYDCKDIDKFLKLSEAMSQTSDTSDKEDTLDYDVTIMDLF